MASRACGVAEALGACGTQSQRQGWHAGRQTSCVTGAPQGEVCALGSVTPTRFVGYACKPSHALPAHCTRLPAATHAVHASALGSYACHTILHTPLPPKAFEIIVLLLQPSSTRLSCCRRVRCSGCALAATASARFYLKDATMRALSRCQTCDTTRACSSKHTDTTPRCKSLRI